jgi:glucosyl-dolichyl phosphate glucuronosyltransferase
MAATLPAVSVIVATLDRCDYLRKCLEALAHQTAGADSFEVLVVDNGSSDGTASMSRDYCRRHPHFRYAFEARAGLSIARNVGVRESRAAIVAFTDDDAVPNPDWITRIAGRFATLADDVAVLGGEVRPIWEAPRPEWLTDPLLRPLSAGLMWSPGARLLRGNEWLVEVNTAYRKEQLTEFGGFSEQLGRVRDSLLSGEGCINQLMSKAGLGLFYDPEIIVGHHIPASRLTRGWFRRRFFWQGVSMNQVASYVEGMVRKLDIAVLSHEAKSWEEIAVPASAAAWADLFDDNTETPFEQQMYTLEQLGYLLQSQSLILGR